MKIPFRSSFRLLIISYNTSPTFLPISNSNTCNPQEGSLLFASKFNSYVILYWSAIKFHPYLTQNSIYIHLQYLQQYHYFKIEYVILTPAATKRNPLAKAFFSIYSSESNTGFYILFHLYTSWISSIEVSFPNGASNFNTYKDKNKSC